MYSQFMIHGQKNIKLYIYVRIYMRVCVCACMCLCVGLESQTRSIIVCLPHYPSTEREGFQRGRTWISTFHTSYHSRLGRCNVRKDPRCPLNLTLGQLQSRSRRVGGKPQPVSWGLCATVFHPIADDSNEW